jgi:HTH-type transcriptional regulator/antitoxin HigA
MMEMTEIEIKPIRTEEDYRHALAEIERLFEAEPGSAECDRLEVLSILVEDYEERHYPVPLPDPIEAIEYYLESRGLSERDLIPYIGSRSRVWEIMNRRRPLSLRMIRNLERALGIPADILIQDYDLVEGPDDGLAECEVSSSTDLAGYVEYAWAKELFAIGGVVSSNPRPSHTYDRARLAKGVPLECER